ncbi:CHAT domain-containing protein [Actinosynnema sp. NPDC020468]|uniref:CHAT domain-containing protein n=1 Tax=Actinosynnema sp. NPDC020468 TaxID=3154488 RepID=UPI0033F42030
MSDHAELDPVSLAALVGGGVPVDRRTAGEVGHLAITEREDEPDEVLLRAGLVLLVHGLADPACPGIDQARWCFAAMIAQSSIASLTGAASDWDAAILWGEAMISVPDLPLDVGESVVVELATYHAERSDVVLTTLVGRPSEQLAEVDRVTGVVLELGELVHAEDTRAEVVLLHGKLLSTRWELTEDTDDLDHAVQALEAALWTLPPSPDLVDDLEQLALLCQQAVDAGRGGRVADLKVAALARAVDHTEEHGFHEWYTAVLLARVDEESDVDALFEAAAWAHRCATAPETAVEDVAEYWTGLAHAHRLLWARTADTAHADIAIRSATEALRFAGDDTDLLVEIHLTRLMCLVPDDHERPDLEAALAEHPLGRWLDEAHAFVLATSDILTADRALLAWHTTHAWFRSLLEADITSISLKMSDHLRLVSDMFDAMLATPGFPPEFYTAVDVMSDLVANMVRVCFGDGDLELKPTTTKALQGPGLPDVIHVLHSMLLNTAGANTGVLAMLDHPFHPWADADPQGAAFAAWSRLARALHLNEGLDTVTGHARVLRDLLQVDRPAGAEAMFSFADVLVDVGDQAHGRSAGPRSRELDRTDPLIRPFAHLSRLAHAAAVGDLATIRGHCADLDDLNRSPLASSSMYREVIANARFLAYRVRADAEPDDGTLDAAIDVGEQCPAPRRGPGLLTKPGEDMAVLLRRRGRPDDLARARASGLRVLAAAQWQVLLQSRGEHALAIARSRSDDTDRMVAWCVEDGAVEDLVRALDARRALVLTAANTTRNAAGALVAAGRTELAEEWAAADSELDLGAARRRVLRELGDEFATSPPEVAEIRRALAAHGSDALVYLVGRTDRHEGMAVVVPAVGDVRVRPLPLLTSEPESPVGRYLAAYDAWQGAGTSTGPEHVAWSERLAEVCDWAWDAAGATLRDAVDVPGTPRLVLVPVGALGAVPWHAAVRRDQGRERRLAEDVRLTSTPSARLFCEAVARTAVTAGRAVLVGNPARDLLPGATEVEALRAAFHPDAVVMGARNRPPRPAVWFPDGPGTPAEVVARLEVPVPVLHLACHAVADMRRPLDSAVHLAGSDVLSAGELLGLSPTRPVDLGLVVLAACATNAGGVDYDETLSLSTAFLAVGARSVVGSLWRVPAGARTVCLMFVLHHHLARGLAPADAVRETQLWALDPNRELPEPAPDHLRRAAREEDLADPRCWAAFVLVGR